MFDQVRVLVNPRSPSITHVTDDRVLGLQARQSIEVNLAGIASRARKIEHEAAVRIGNRMREQVERCIGSRLRLLERDKGFVRK
jgi:hypothetical protein